MISRLYKADKLFLWFAICGSLLFSAWAVYSDDIPNNDGVEYLKAAAAILDGNWSAAFQTYKWPFYSLLIALVSGVSGLSLSASAYALNAVFNAWIVVAFVALSGLLGGKRSTLWFALLVILAFPTFNKFRPYLIRDPAFLALFLSGCYAYFLYIKEGAGRHNAVVIACFVLSALFRMEGLIYLFMTQSYLLVRHFAEFRSRVISLIALVLLGVVLLAFMSWWQFSSTGTMGYESIFTDPAAFMAVAWEQIGGEFNHRLEVVEEHVLVGYSRSYAWLVLFWSAITIVVLKIIHTLYYLYFVLWLVADRKGLLFPQGGLYPAWRYLVVVSLPILFSFVMVQWFLTARYVSAMALLMLLATPFLLDYWYAQYQQQGRYRVRFWLVVVLIAVTGVKSLDLSTNKHYLKAAADWMSANLPEDAQAYTNNRILGYYYGRDIRVDTYWTDWRMYLTGALVAKKEVDYAAFDIKQEDAAYIEGLSRSVRRKILAIFENRKGSRVVVFDLAQFPDRERPEPILVE